MKVRSKLLLIVAVSIALTTIPGLAIIFFFSQKDIISNESVALAEETSRLADISIRRFSASEVKLKALVRLLENALNGPDQPGELEKFNSMVEVGADGAIRSRKSDFNGQIESGIFLPPAPQKSDQQKIEYFRIKQMLDVFGLAGTRRFENVYFLAADKSAIIMDRAKPDFVFEMTADQDFSSTPWVQLGSPANNPERMLRFTPPMFDPVWKTWMVSAVIPLYRGSRWLGSIGEDMQLTNVLAFMFESGARYAGEQHFLMDSAGNFILAGAWQQLLETDQQAFEQKLREMPKLSELFEKVPASSCAILSKDFRLEKKSYLAFGEKFTTVGWRYVRLVPVDDVVAPVWRFFIALVLVIIILAVVTCIMIETATTRSISRRIMLLVEALESFNSGSYQISQDVLTGGDEISAAARSFVQMAEKQSLILLENKKHVHELHKAEQKYRSLVNNSQSIIFTIASDLKVSFVSPGWKILLGHNNDEILGVDFRTLIHEQDRGVFETLLAKKPAAEGAETGAEFRVFHKNGSIRWHRSVISPVFDEQGSISMYVGNALDITARKQAEQQLRQSEERLRLLIKNSSDTLVVLDAEGRQQFVSPASEKFTGYPVKELEGLKIQDIIHPDDLSEVLRAWNDALAHPEKIVSVQYRHIHKTRGWTFFEAVAQNFFAEPSIRGMVASVRDITERKQAEKEKEGLQEQLRQAQKMESIGRLAGGIAHDFNNMLGVILGRTELALSRPDQVAKPVIEDLKEIRKAADRSARLTRQLQAFARQQTVIPVVLDLNETIEGMLKMQRRLVGENIDLIWLPGKGVNRVKIDPAQIDQILSNLCVNAGAALGNSGQITIKTEEIQNQILAPEQAVPGDFVLLSVSDNGCGMDEATMANIFEPFFTTRPLGEVTGLGLATVYGIVRQNGGFIKVLSRPGEGTTFRIFLPRYAGEAEKVVSGGAVKAGSDEKVTILLTEDEPAILNLGTTMLEMLGYRVLAAATPEDAIRLASEYSGKIQLLLTDVIMPGMNGGSLAEKLFALYPRLKCLFMSGYTADVIAHHGVLIEGVHFIQKPFTMKELATKVRETLAAENETTVARTSSP